MQYGRFAILVLGVVMVASGCAAPQQQEELGAGTGAEDAGEERIAQSEAEEPELDREPERAEEEPDSEEPDRDGERPGEERPAETEEPDVEETGVAYEVIAEGTQAAKEEAERVIVRDREELERVWSQAMGSRTPVPEAPEIDFAERTVVALFMGRRSTGGYAIRVSEVVREGEQLRVRYREREPGPDEMVTQALTSPYQIVSVPKTEEIELKRE